MTLWAMALISFLPAMAIDPCGARVDREGSDNNIWGPFIFFLIMIVVAWIKVSQEDKGQ